MNHPSPMQEESIVAAIATARSVIEALKANKSIEGSDLFNAVNDLFVKFQPDSRDPEYAEKMAALAKALLAGGCQVLAATGLHPAGHEAYCSSLFNATLKAHVVETETYATILEQSINQ